jgi:glutathione peroxidase-family protein
MSLGCIQASKTLYVCQSGESLVNPELCPGVTSVSPSTIPHLNNWQEKYWDKGLVIIGVHSPEFAFEKDLSNLKDAIEKHDIKYPVVQDNNFNTWGAYENRYWPTKYLIDKNGLIRYQHIGEEAYDETQEMIVKLLEEL